MDVFWNGFFAGTIAIVLPSLTWFALAVRNAPEIVDGRVVR